MPQIFQIFNTNILISHTNILNIEGDRIFQPVSSIEYCSHEVCEPENYNDCNNNGLFSNLEPINPNEFENFSTDETDYVDWVIFMEDNERDFRDIDQLRLEIRKIQFFEIFWCKKFLAPEKMANSEAC